MSINPAFNTPAEKLLAAGVEPTKALLHCAEWNASDICTPQAVRALLHAGADVNAKNRVHGATPLMMMARYAPSSVLKILVDAGADVNATDGDGMTALLEATRWMLTDNVRFLREAGADIKAVNNEGKDAVAYANDCPWKKPREAMLAALAA